MPSRILRDSIVTSPSLARCSPGAQDRFPRYTIAADDFGCFEASPMILRGKMFPYRQDMTDDAVAADLAEYRRELMLEVWEENGRRYGFFVSWGRHQRVREADDHKAKGNKFKSRRKTPTPPSVRPFGTLAAYYGADADRAFAELPAVAGHSRATATRCPPQSQSQTQSQTQVKPSPSDPPVPGVPPADVGKVLTLLSPPDRPLDRALQVFEYWRKVSHKNGATVFDDKRRKKVESQIKLGRTVADLCKAVDGCVGDAWHVQHRATDLELICRDAPHVEQFIGYADNPRANDACGPGTQPTQYRAGPFQPEPPKGRARPDTADDLRKQEEARALIATQKAAGFKPTLSKGAA